MCPIQQGNACCLHVAVGGKVGYVACQVLWNTSKISLHFNAVWFCSVLWLAMLIMLHPALQVGSASSTSTSFPLDSVCHGSRYYHWSGALAFSSCLCSFFKLGPARAGSLYCDEGTVLYLPRLGQWRRDVWTREQLLINHRSSQQEMWWVPVFREH